MHDDDEAGSATAVLGAPTELGRRLHSDPHDFAGLYIRHHSSFTLHARRYLRDQRDADEVVQEAFLRLFLALPELETELQALAYCRRTITNLCIDRYRAQARRPRLVDLDSAPVDLLVDDDPGDPVVRAEDAAVVRDALSRLSPLHRAALVKREIEEKPLPVIAQELSIPEDHVKHLLFRARRALRRLLVGTTLAPGADAERGPDRAAAVRAGSGSLGALALLLVLGLGSGPNLEAVPVVGVDLPDVLGVTEIARTVGNAVTDVVDRVSSAPAPSTSRSSGGARDELRSGAAEGAGAAQGPGPAAGTSPTAPVSGLTVPGPVVPPASGSTSSAPAVGSVVVRPVPAGVPAASGLLPVSPPSGTTGTSAASSPGTRAATPSTGNGTPASTGGSAAPAGPASGGGSVPGPAVPVPVSAAGTPVGSDPRGERPAKDVPSPGSPAAPPAAEAPRPADTKVDDKVAKVEAKAEEKVAKVEAKEQASAGKAEDKVAKVEAKAEEKVAKAEQKAAKAEEKAAGKDDRASLKVGDPTPTDAPVAPAG